MLFTKKKILFTHDPPFAYIKQGAIKSPTARSPQNRITQLKQSTKWGCSASQLVGWGASISLSSIAIRLRLCSVLHQMRSRLRNEINVRPAYSTAPLSLCHPPLPPWFVIRSALLWIVLVVWYRRRLQWWRNHPFLRVLDCHSLESVPTRYCPSVHPLRTDAPLVSCIYTHT